MLKSVVSKLRPSTPKIFETPIERSPIVGRSMETEQLLSELNQQKELYAILQIHEKSMRVSRNDLVIAPRMKLNLGDKINLDRVRELGCIDWRLEGNPYILPDYFIVTGVVIEHTISKDITRKHWKKSGVIKSVTNQTHHTVIRIDNIEINVKDS